MAYNQSARFQYSHERFRIFDPGAYQYPSAPLIHSNKVPFLSKAPRETSFKKIWTHTVYFPKKQEHIPNCTSFRSKVPRFSYEVKKPEAVKEVLCDCGSDYNLCTCPEKNEDIKKKTEICQGKIRRRLFTGPANGYPIKNIVKPPIDVPFYETRVQEFTAFYRGCRWSRRTSRREMKISERGPGPADYNLEQLPKMSEICAEKVRAKRRKTSNQLRFIEIVQTKTLRDNYPGPASYSPFIPERKDFRCRTSGRHKSSPKTKSADLTNNSPGPADYFIPRYFDVIIGGRNKCHAKLPSPVPFGVKDVRFKQRTYIGPSPASYSINRFNLCHKSNWKQCNHAPFGSTSKRFKETLFDDGTKNEENDDRECNEKLKCIPKSSQSTWEFRSKTIRMMPPKFTITGTYENPVDNSNTRSKKLQYLSPFHSSEGRFRNWYNWISIYGSVRTPDPGRYSIEKPKCAFTVLAGTFSRQRRFVPYRSETPAPNQFVLDGCEKYVMHTHNYKLRKNIRKRSKW